MTAYKNMTLDQRRAEYAALQTAFEDLKAQGLKLDMTRGKPCKDQLDMVSDIFDMLKEPEDYIVDGIDIRNYGALSGLPEAPNGWLHLYPHEMRGEGHFVSRLRKSADAPAPQAEMPCMRPARPAKTAAARIPSAHSGYSS